MLLEARLCELGVEPVANVQTRELTRQSLKKIVNQMQKEIIRFQAHQVASNTLERVGQHHQTGREEKLAIVMISRYALPYV